MAEIIFINSFEVPEGRDDAFLELWTQIDSYMCGKPGFRSAPPAPVARPLGPVALRERGGLGLGGAVRRRSRR